MTKKRKMTDLESELIPEEGGLSSGSNDIPFDSSSAPLYNPEEEEEGFTPDTDFNLEDEYKPEPLVAGGNYRGNVIAVTFEAEQNAIAWKVALADNGGVMSDGETPIDGSHHYYRNWLPKPGDETERSKDGRSTKRQTKINMTKRFADDMKINMNTPSAIAGSITNQDWIGIPVIATITLNEYMGVTRNQINKMVALEE